MTLSLGLERHPWIDALAQCLELLPGVVVTRGDDAHALGDALAADRLDGALLCPSRLDTTASVVIAPLGVFLAPGSALLRLVVSSQVEHPRRVWSAPQSRTGRAVLALLAAARWRFPVEFVEHADDADAWLYEGEESAQEARDRVLDLTLEWHEFLGAPVLWRVLFWRPRAASRAAALIDALAEAVGARSAPIPGLGYHLADEWLATVARYSSPAALITPPGSLS